jgi:hypothetical protein
MQTSAFQLGLISALSLGLGLAVSSKAAIGYPTGAVSYGANPVVSVGGYVYQGTPETVISAPIDQDLVITDVVLASTTGTRCKRTHQSQFNLVSGDSVAHFVTNSAISDTYNGGNSDAGTDGNYHFQSGIRVPAGDAITMTVVERWAYGYSCVGSASDYPVHYTISGYLAQQ